jgi:CRP-like cAMP-binding protein
VLLDAAIDSEGVLAHPPPKVFLVEFADSAITYEVKYWIHNHGAYNEITDALRTSIWYGLRRAGIAMPYPVRTVQIERAKRPEPFRLPEETRALIRKKPFFQTLTEEQVAKIVGAATFSLFGRGEHVVEQGADGSSMFVLLSGGAEVYVRQAEHGGEPRRVAALQVGDYFGEMSLLTGEKRSATIRATSDCQVLEIAKAQMGQILQENAALLKSLSQMLAQRRLDNEGVLASNAGHQTMSEKKKEYEQGFLRKVASFFDL